MQSKFVWNGSVAPQAGLFWAEPLTVNSVTDSIACASVRLTARLMSSSLRAACGGNLPVPVRFILLEVDSGQNSFLPHFGRGLSPHLRVRCVVIHIQQADYCRGRRACCWACIDRPLPLRQSFLVQYLDACQLAFKTTMSHCMDILI